MFRVHTHGQTLIAVVGEMVHLNIHFPSNRLANKNRMVVCAFLEASKSRAPREAHHGRCNLKGDEAAQRGGGRLPGQLRSLWPVREGPAVHFFFIEGLAVPRRCLAVVESITTPRVVSPARRPSAGESAGYGGGGGDNVTL